MVVPSYDGCPWPVDTACFTDEWETYSTAVQDRSIALASSTLERLTGYRVSNCPVTVRPCVAGCITGLRGYQEQWGYGVAWSPMNYGGVWSNCGCSPSDCACESLCEVLLPGPVGRIDSVKVDGQVVAPSKYRVDNGNKLVWAPPPVASDPQPYDGINDPWRWSPGNQAWVSVGYRITWEPGQTIHIPLCAPVSNNTLYVSTNSTPSVIGADATIFGISSAEVSGTVTFADAGSGIVWFVQGESNFTHTTVPNNFDLVTLLGEVTVGAPYYWVTLGSDEPCPWPTCQDMDQPDTQLGTFSVTYLNAYPVDSLGAYAAGILAMEYGRACAGGSCRLPLGVTSIARQGISMEIASGAFPGGLTGLREVDAYIALWNPDGQRQASAVYSPDRPRVRHTTWGTP